MFYPSDGLVPEALQVDEFFLRPLRATDVYLAYDAVISSRAELLRASGGTWSKDGFTLMDLRSLQPSIPKPIPQGTT
jgi:hypothetical protein